jgi:hypothetical protein
MLAKHSPWFQEYVGNGESVVLDRLEDAGQLVPDVPKKLTARMRLKPQKTITCKAKQSKATTQKQSTRHRTVHRDREKIRKDPK